MRMVDSKIRNTVIHIIALEEVATLYLWYCRMSECLIEKIGPVLHVYFIRFDVIEVIRTFGIPAKKNLKMMVGRLRDQRPKLR